MSKQKTEKTNPSKTATNNPPTVTTATTADTNNPPVVTAAPTTEKKEERPAAEPLILWVNGGKGGVGKTTTARILTDLMLEKTDSIYGYDCDPINPQFKRFYGAEYLPLTDPDRKTADIAAEALAERIEARAHDYIIIDSPAGEVDMLGQLENRFAFISNLKSMNAKLTRVFIMSTTPESVNLLQRSLDDTKGLPVGHVAVRNLHFGGPHYFETYNHSKTKKLLEERWGKTVNFPALGEIATESIDQKSLTYSEAASKESGLPMMRRSMIYQWREQVRSEFAQAGRLLGLN